MQMFSGSSKDKDRLLSSRHQRDYDSDFHRARRPVNPGYEGNMSPTPISASFSGHMPGSFETRAEPRQFNTFQPPNESLGFSREPTTPLPSVDGFPSQMSRSQLPPTPPSESKLHDVTTDLRPSRAISPVPSENSSAESDTQVPPVPPLPTGPPVVPRRAAPPQDTPTKTVRSAPAARVLEPTIPTGKEGAEWEQMLDGLTFHSAKENEFLDLVDEMRKHGLDRELSLPRLVVCGKESSGKSSVLEAITRLPFPRGDTTCTRFVTEIRMIRDTFLSGTSVKVTIQPGDDRGDSDKIALRSFKATCTPSGFGSIFGTAAKAMGLATSSTATMTAFSRDTLCIEIKGPHCQRISLIDLPGLISANKGDVDDIRLVEAITDEYIRDDRTVILAVINAEGSTNGHSILEKARHVDPKGERTFGIITKPDRLEAGLDNENQWFNLALQNSDAFFTFGKGCHVMVNRDGHDTKDGTSSDTRDRNEEKFFASETWGPGFSKNEGKANRWHGLYETTQWGVKHLRPRLTQLLFRHTQKQIKSLRMDSNKRIAGYDAEIKRLSAGLLDPKDLRKVIMKKCSEMSHLTVQGVDGTNRDADFFGVDEFDLVDGPARFLRGRIRDESEAFNSTIYSNGHRTGYAWDPERPIPESISEVDRFYNFLLKTKGTELPGNFDPQRLIPLFINYSKEWYHLAQDYLNRTFIHSREFIQLVVAEVLGKELPQIENNFKSLVLYDRLEKLKENADLQLLEIEKDRKGNVITEDKRFLTEAAERFADRQARWLNEGAKDELATEEPGAINLTKTDDKTKQAAIRMIEEMQIYYKVARARYVDDVIIQVVERCLLSKLRNLFDQDWMETAELYDNVTQDPHTEERRRARDAVTEKRKNLRHCLIRLESLDR